MSECKCALCGCTNKRSLAKVVDEDIWLCNTFCDAEGKMSHLFRYLKRNSDHEVSLHPENEFKKELKCQICGNTNIFDLGFLQINNEKCIVCNAIKCLNNEQFQGNKHFTPIIASGRFNEEILESPKQNPEGVTSEDVSRKFNELIGKNEEKEKRHLPHTKDKYDSAEEFVNIHTELIQAELVADIVKCKNSTIDFENVKWEDKTKFFVTLTKKSQKRIFKNIVAVEINKKKGGIPEIAYLEFSTKKNELEFHLEVASKFYLSDKLKLTPISNAVTAARQIEAINKFMKPEYNEKSNAFFESETYNQYKNVFLGQIDFSEFWRCNFQKNIDLVFPDNFPKLNHAQVEAAKSALSHKFTIIQGPPGTGKTTTIVAIVNSLVAAKQTPVLVVGHSNITADMVCKALSDNSIDTKRVLSTVIENHISVVMDDETVESTVNYSIPGFKRSDFSTFQMALEEFEETFGRQYDKKSREDYKQLRKIESKYIKESKVICCTTSTSGSGRMTNKKGFPLEFKAVIFDEAGQCVDPDFIISLCHRPIRTILVGDIKQLGPVLISNNVKNSGFAENVLHRLDKINITPILLDRQYRMHPRIMEFPSDTFYKSLVKSGISAEDRKFNFRGEGIKWPNPEFGPLLFWDVEGIEQIGPNGVSRLCVEQAKATAEILDKLIDSGVQPNSIGVISPYNAHNDYMVDYLADICTVANEIDIDNIEISTVDAFQGREKDFIIFNLVRSNDVNDIGFMGDLTRLNVSITRAKYGLFVIGNTKTFISNADYVKWINYFQQNGALVEGQHFSELTVK